MSAAPRAHRAAAAAVLAAATLLLAALPAPAGAAPSRERMVRSAVSWAVKQVGVRERGQSNCGPGVTVWQQRMGFRVPPCRPWCGAFVHEAFRQAGVRLGPRLIDPQKALNDARRRRGRLRAVGLTSVRKGDILVMDSRRAGKATHMAIAVADYRRASGTVRTVEGNNGHTVRRGNRPRAALMAAIRVDPGG